MYRSGSKGSNMQISELLPGDKFILVSDLVHNHPEKYPDKVNIYIRLLTDAGFREKDGESVTFKPDTDVIQLISDQIPSFLWTPKQTTQRTSCNEETHPDVTTLDASDFSRLRGY